MGLLAEGGLGARGDSRPDHRYISPMVRIGITDAAFEAIAATLPLGSVGFEPEPNAEGERQIWLDAAVVDRLSAMRLPGETYSDVILRLVELEAR